MKFADSILRGATFFAGKGLNAGYDFVAVADGKILAVGRGEAWKDYASAHTKIFELTKEHLVIPGFHDSHLHLLMSALNFNYVDLGDAKSEDEAARLTTEFAATIPKDEWIIGLNWYHMRWEGRSLPTVKSLDKYMQDRPVFLINSEVHGAWVNSAALKKVGITGDTPNPEYGEIVKFENGDPSGYLNEKAMGLVGRVALKFPIEKEKALVKSVVRNYAAHGVTAVQDLRPELGYDMGQYETFYSMEQEDDLDIRVHSAASLFDTIEETSSAQRKYNGEIFRISLLKQYMDGVPTTHTAMVTEPYEDMPGEYGAPINDLGKLQECVYAAHREGMSVKIHCCGDRAVTEALNLYENAIKRYGDTGARHSVEHAEIIRPADVERFKKYHIIASMQPEHMTSMVEKHEDNPYYDFYGEELMKQAWIFRTLLDENITVAFGTDCPVVGIDPLINIYRAVTRTFDDGKPEGGVTPEQRITVEEALHCYTYNSAYCVHREHELGTLEPGKYADIAVLDTDILRCEPIKIKDTKVLLTMMNGKITHNIL